jgi:hypothetical protein
MNARLPRAVCFPAFFASLLLSLAGCAHAPSPAGTAGKPAAEAKVRNAPEAPDADSVTIALWHLDETGGSRAADSGPYRLEAVSGIDTRPDFGRFRDARRFTQSLDSFVYARYNPMFESGGAFTIEAWIQPTAYGSYEDTPIAGRWTPLANQQSWLLAVVGRRLSASPTTRGSPGDRRALVSQGRPGALMFAFMPADAGLPQAYFSNRQIELNRWTHVAATLDGMVVRLYIDGLFDSQYAITGRIRPTDAPLLLGNYFDPRQLTDFGGDLRVDATVDPYPYYAFQGLIDEVRLSSAVRTRFPSTGVR